MKKLMMSIAVAMLVVIAAIALFGCNPPGNPEGGNPDGGQTPEREYTNEVYSNPLRFYKQDGSEYQVTVADPDVYRDDESGYFYMY